MEETKKIVFEEDYVPDCLNDEEEVYRLKEALNKLNGVQKQIFLNYCEIGTYAGTARYYGVSVPTIKKYVGEIRNKIFQNL